jgi:hypothetical protein
MILLIRGIAKSFPKEYGHLAAAFWFKEHLAA